MRTLAWVVGLARGAGALWVRHLPAMGSWFCLGWAARELGLLVSVQLGGNRLVWATLAFVLGLVVWVICLVLMIHSLEPGLIAPREDAVGEALPGVLAAHGSKRELLLHGVAPFLAVYAVWGFAEEQIQALFQANLSTQRDVSEWTIGFNLWPTFAAIAAVAWVALGVLGLLGRRRSGLALSLGQLFAKGTFVLASFIALAELATQLQTWLRGRAFWSWLMVGWERFLAWLPDWRLFFELTLPEALREAVAGLWNVLVPGTLDWVLLPLVWLALCASVFGWRDFTRGVRAADAEATVMRGLGRAGQTRLVRRARQASTAGPLRALLSWARGEAEDYLPVLQAFRLITRAGAPFVGAYLLLAALLKALWIWAGQAVMWLVGARTFAETVGYLPVRNLVLDLLFWTLSVSLYAAAFDRALLAASGASRAVRPAPRTPLAAG